MSQEDNIFSMLKPRGPIPRRDSTALVAEIDAAELKPREEYVVPTHVTDLDYILQVAEYNGLNTCNPTSVLNGLVHQGYLTKEQAQATQHHLVTDRRQLFSTRHFGDQIIETYAVPTTLLIDVVKEATGVEVALRVEEVTDLSQKRTEKLLRLRLEQEYVIIGGNKDHAVLLVGYDQQGDKLLYRDPMQPATLRKTNTSQFARDLRLTGEPWISIIPKPAVTK